MACLRGSYRGLFTSLLLYYRGFLYRGFIHGFYICSISIIILCLPLLVHCYTSVSLYYLPYLLRIC